MDPPTRPAIPVRVTEVAMEEDDRDAKCVNYAITLSCGCHWCEERGRSERAPEVGAVAYCATKHSRLSLF